MIGEYFFFGIIVMEWTANVGNPHWPAMLPSVTISAVKDRPAMLSRWQIFSG
jgi:hypothetical protein